MALQLKYTRLRFKAMEEPLRTDDVQNTFLENKRNKKKRRKNLILAISVLICFEIILIGFYATVLDRSVPQNR